jgi:hypothetical protein
VRQSFRAEFKLSVDKAVSQDDQAIDERMFARTRQQLLQPFLETNRLVLYDLPLSRLSGSVPVIMKEAVTDILKAEMRAVPLAIDVFTELPSAYKPVFEELQNFEREPLRHLRAGRIDQEEYLKHLKEKVREHREIDVRLSDGLPKRLDRILTLRNRFGERGGWQTVQDFLAAYDRAAPVEELAELERELDEKLLFCHKPLPTEFGRVLIRLTKTLSKLYPAVHYAEIVSDAYRDAESLKPLLNELMTYFRGDVRGHGGRA